MKGLSFFLKLIYILNVPFGFILLISYLANFINPSYFPYIGLVGLGYPLWLAINLIFVLIWTIALKKQVLFSLVCILIGYNQIFAIFQANGQHKVFAKNSHKMHVMSYNVRTFSKQLFNNWEESAKAISKVITDENADLVCFQEFYQNPNTARFNYRYKHIHFTNKSFGLAIMSKYKMVNKGTVEYGTQDGVYKLFIYADILNDKKDTIRVINAHLLSVGLDSKNLSQLPDSEITQEELEKQKQKIIAPLLKGYKGRGKQAKKLGDFIAQSPYPVILCSDFNDTPGSYAYRQVSRSLEDTFVKSGQGFGTTLPYFKKLKLPMRIDHIFTSNYFKPFNYEVVQKGYSDHFPVVVDLEY